MKIVRFINGDGKIVFGNFKDNTVSEIEDGFNAISGRSFGYTGVDYDFTEINLLTPSEPSKIICLGLNYRSHALEMNLPLPQRPILFIKPSTSVLAHGKNIVCPPQSRRVDYEAELGVVIGKKAYRVPKDKAHDYILGYTCANDVTARDLQPKEGQWTYAKGFDTFAPFGPWIETGIDNPESLSIKGYLNGETVQSGNTADHIFSVSEIIHFISSCMTLLPGDLIMTGTPSGIGPMKPGDIVEIEISGIGKLANTVVKL